MAHSRRAGTSAPNRLARPGCHRSRGRRLLWRGQKCPACGQGRLDYDGLLQLSCPVCGHVAKASGFT